MSLLHQLQDVTSAQLANLSQELSQLQQRQVATAAKMGSDAAATRAQVAELRQWFDANQVGHAEHRLLQGHDGHLVV
jgi:hypothetical protein